MIKRLLLPGILLAFTSPVFSQTLFTYGKNTATATEFIRAYSKNNTQPVANKQKAMQDYLELYINSRLKIKEAYSRGYDTLPQIKLEVENLRNQILENYMSDPETMDALTKEAFQRSLKDVHAAHIFIGANPGDTATAYLEMTKLVDRLKKGEDFLTVAQQFSQDPSAKTNKGDMGWITVFTLPYMFETPIYTTKPRQISGIIRSKAGYHLFKNIAERNAVGKMKARQILLAYPPKATDADKKTIARRADSLYKRIIAGDDFSKLAQQFSNDYISAVTGGTLPDFGIGEYDGVFEKNVWGLPKDGALTKPFETTHGYHIVKRISLVPITKDTASLVTQQDLRQKIIQDARWVSSRDVIYDRVSKKANLKMTGITPKNLWAYTDSLLDRQPLGIGSDVKPETELFTIGDTVLRAQDWINYAQAFRFKSDGTGRRSYPEVMNDFLHSIVFQYYRDHLENFNEDFRYQMTEFKDGNLFFEIMQQEIWNRAHSDTTELLALYETNKSKYMWTKSADAVIFFCSDENIAKTLFAQIKKNPSNWRSLTEALAEKVVADSARYEWDQIPSKTKIIPTTGLVTTPLVNTTDNSASFAYIIKTYPNPVQRSYNEAKGLVINDYQALLEEQWIKKLREKYPVVVDQKVMNAVSK